MYAMIVSAPYFACKLYMDTIIALYV